jgi:drug/metabolite transporter (DMT)-like permease
MSGGPPTSAPDGRADPRALAASRALRGLGLMFASTFLFAAMHASIRHLSEAIHPFEIAFFRSLFSLVVVAPWLYRDGLALLQTRHLGLHTLRAVLNVFAMLSFFYALSITPLSEVTALGFTAPIFTTMLAAMLLREVVGLHRWSAIAVGFLGTLTILRPGFAEIGTGQMLTLFSSLVWAFALLTIKTLGRTDSSATIIAFMALLMMPMTLVPAAFVWRWPDGTQLFWLVLVGLLGGVGQLCVTEALRQTETAVVMPIDFCKLPWVAGIAYLAFGEVPDRYTWLGGAIIFASAMYIVYRERRLAGAGR